MELPSTTTSSRVTSRDCCVSGDGARRAVNFQRRRWNVKTRMRAGFISFVMSYAISASLKGQATSAVVPSHSDSLVAQRVAGCYELLRDGWESDSNLTKFELFPRDRIRFELTTTPARGWDALWAHEHVTYFDVLMDSIAQWGRVRLFATWNRARSSTESPNLSDTQPTIIISRPLPMAGYALRVTLRGTDLVGTIVAFTDALSADGKSSASHAATARRIPCARRGQ